MIRGKVRPSPLIQLLMRRVRQIGNKMCGRGTQVLWDASSGVIEVKVRTDNPVGCRVTVVAPYEVAADKFDDLVRVRIKTILDADKWGK